jgi:Phytanoyl-CoA dioxygenase (PhyH)
MDLTSKQRELFLATGFLVFENVLNQMELRKLNRVADLLYSRQRANPESRRLEIRNCVARHSALLQMIDHPTLLPVIVDLLGPNIKVRTSELDIRPPVPAAGRRQVKPIVPWGQPERWHIDGPLFGYPAVEGIVPMMEIRVGYYLTDLREPDSGQLCLVPGSHRIDYRHLESEVLNIPDKQIFRVAVPPGSAILFRTGVWHCVSCNRNGPTRKVLYIAYTHRWIHGSDYITQSPSLLRKCSPIQRQLLGGSARLGRSLLGEEPRVTPRSLFWFTRPDDIPLLGFYEKKRRHRRKGDRVRS